MDPLEAEVAKLRLAIAEMEPLRAEVAQLRLAIAEMDQLHRANIGNHTLVATTNQTRTTGADLVVDIAILLTNEDQVKPWLMGSCCSRSLEGWVERRKFFVSVFNKNGSVLDVGCANGLFLACLQYWSPHRFTPFGFDVNDPVQQAALLFPSHPENFRQMNIDDYLRSKPSSFPSTFDFVFWNVWKDFDLERNVRYVDSLVALVSSGGRIVFGFYDSEETNLRKISQLRTLGYDVETVQCPTDSHMAAWLDIH